MGLDVAAAAGVALLLTVVALPPAIAFLRRRAVLDEPNHRSSHDQPTPRGGGVAVALATVVATAIFAPADNHLYFLVVVGLAFAAVGGTDDLTPRSAPFRLAAQSGLAIVAAVNLARIDGEVQGVAALVGIAVIVVYVNAFNFMDGINGISGTQAAVVGATLAALGAFNDDPLLAVAGTAVAAASVGFLPFNLPTARIFLGDVGSYFIGAWLAMLATRALASGIHPVAVALPFALYLADTGFTLLRRAERGEPLLEAHREHAYQRLVQGGRSHTATTALVTGVTALCGVAAIAVDLSPAGGAILAVVALGAVGWYLWLPSAPTTEHRRAITDA